MLRNLRFEAYLTRGENERQSSETLIDIAPMLLFHSAMSVELKKGEKLTNGRIQTRKPKPAFICNKDKRNMITDG